MRVQPKRARISIEVTPEVRQRLRLAAGRRDISVRDYVLEAITERLRMDIGESAARVNVLAAAADPVLTELWDNEHDAAYDRQ